MRIAIAFVALTASGCAAAQETAPPSAAAPVRRPLPMVRLASGETALLATCGNNVGGCYAQLEAECGGRYVIVDAKTVQIAGADPGLPPAPPPVDLSGVQTTTGGATVYQAYERGRARAQAAAAAQDYARAQRAYEERLADSAPRLERQVAAQCAP